VTNTKFLAVIPAKAGIQPCSLPYFAPSLLSFFGTAKFFSKIRNFLVDIAKFA
jgi:hypothetical protein